MNRLMTAAEAAARLKVSRQTLYAYVSRGLVGSTDAPEDPRCRLYRGEDIERLAARKAQGRKPDRVAERTLDWGLPVLESAITLIEGGRLFYRGRDAVGLAESGSLEGVARLLWASGAAGPFIPDASPLPVPAAWRAVARSLAAAPAIERCLALLALAAGDEFAIWPRESPRLWQAGAALLRTVAAAAAGTEPSDRPIHLHLAQAWALDEADAGLLRRALVLCADHELNASTFTVRCVASTGASLRACVAAGLAALSGPRHGGMTARVEALFDEIAHRGGAEQVVQDRMRRGDPVPGFGHPLYPEGDPRGRALLSSLRPDRERDALIAAVERVAGHAPNIDLALVALARVLRLPPGAPLALFAVGRTAGWIAHAFEQQAAGRLIRPRARYVGTPPGG